MHTIWLSIFVPIMFFLIWGIPEFRRRSIWIASIALTTIAIAAFLGFKLQLFTAGGSTDQLLQKGLFTLVSSTDLPLLAILVGGVVNFFSCWFLPKGTSCGCCGSEVEIQPHDPLNQTAI